jgi:hypothetical protein
VKRRTNGLDRNVPVALQWIVDAYAVVFAGLLLSAGATRTLDAPLRRVHGVRPGVR